MRYTSFFNWMAGFTATAALLTACGGQPKDNPTRGEITIASDESFQPVVESLTKAYQGIYADTRFNIIYKPEAEAIQTLLRDSARLVFATRDLTQQEKAALRQKKIQTKAQHIATDGLALIINKANTDSLMTLPELKGIFEGQIRNWSQLKGGNQTGPIVLVFDNSNSSNLNFMLGKFSIKNLNQLRLFSVKSNKQVIEYVRKNPAAIGFIGVNWISDGDEPLTRELSRDLRVVGVSDKVNPVGIDDYYQPFQRNLGLETYPLRRKLYIISREMHPGLGGGLMTYIARDVGSLVIEKSGLWPTIPYNREVYMKKL